MRAYKWRARNRAGKIVKGRHVAESPQEVAVFVRKNHGYVISIKVEEPPSLFNRVMWRRSLSLKQKEYFFQQLGKLLDSGISLIRSLELMAERQQGLIAEVMLFVRRDIEKGISLSQAVKKQYKYFSPLTAKVIEAGEQSGNLPFVASYLAEYYQKQRELKNTLINAIIYPSLVVLCGFCTLSYFLFRILPIFLELYAVMQLEALGCLKHLGVFLSYFSFSTFMVLCLSLLVLSWALRGTFFRLLLKLPFFRRIYVAWWEAKYCRLLALLLRSGISLATGLKLLASLLPPLYFGGVGEAIAHRVLGGMPLSQAVTIHAGIFGPLSLQLIGLGEEDGSIATKLMDAAELLDEEMNLRVKRFKILLEPILLLMLTGIIGILVYFIFSPVYGLVSQIPDYN